MKKELNNIQWYLGSFNSLFEHIREAKCLGISGVAETSRYQSHIYVFKYFRRGPICSRLGTFVTQGTTAFYHFLDVYFIHLKLTNFES